MTRSPTTIEVTTKLEAGMCQQQQQSPGNASAAAAAAEHPVSPTPTSSAVKMKSSPYDNNSNHNRSSGSSPSSHHHHHHSNYDSYRRVTNKRKRSSGDIGSNGGSNVVFSTKSRYHPIVWSTTIVIPIAILFTWLLQHKSQIFRNNNKEDVSDNDDLANNSGDDDYYKFDNSPIGNSSPEFWGLVWTMILVLCIYMVILPKQVDVRSNGSIGIKTFLVTFQFPHVARAYISEPLLFQKDDFNMIQRPRLKFESHPWSKVVVLRRHGRWDVTVSPKDAQGFIDAIDKVIHQLESTRSSSTTTIPGSNNEDVSGGFGVDSSSKPDLASA